LEKQRRANAREVGLREKLQTSYDEQEILVQQQQTLLAELNQLYWELMQVALTDAITGLPNHRAVMSRLEEVVAHCQRIQGSCAVLFVDLNDFKRVNDTWGHRAGDQLLRTAVDVENFVGRYGGEEFVILLTEVDRQAASQMAEDLCSVLVSPPYSWQPNAGSSAVPISISASIGVAVYPLHGGSGEALLEAADRAMYQAKHTGRCVWLADGEIASPHDMQPMPDDREHTAEVMVVQALTAAALVHDWRTATHAERMVQLAQATARQLKRPEEEVHLVGLAAVLHDIGKIGIPDAILHKPGPLTEEERSIIHRHPEIGRQMLAQIGGVFGRLAHSVGAHHERWDGRGYPHGLVKNAIPLSARILTVVDSYDAMTSPRPYRQEPFTAVKAKTELQRGAESQYDPCVVEAFLSVLAEQENTQGPLEESKAPGTSDKPNPNMHGTTGNVWQQMEQWRQQMEQWRQQQFIWQQRIEALEQQQQHLAWQKQELEQRQKPFTEARSK